MCIKYVQTGYRFVKEYVFCVTLMVLKTHLLKKLVSALDFVHKVGTKSNICVQLSIL